MAINVTKTFLPPFDEYVAVLKKAWDKAWITNNGALAIELEEKLKEYINADNLLYCSNGTIVLQMALKALGISKEVITTPFSYVATTNALLWESCTPVFVDIDEKTFCIDATKIEAAITNNTQAILATHVYGYPCDVAAIQAIADKYNLKVIYDAAHAFGCIYKGKSLLAFGDISTCSFHATKIFHSVEGGAIFCNTKALSERIFLYRHFGHIGDEYFSVGINAKNSEFHAAMGLSVLPYVTSIIESRKAISAQYNSLLNQAKLLRPAMPRDFDYNYGYYPVIFESEDVLARVYQNLRQHDIFPRRYFYPSLNELPFIKYQPCKISESISRRVLCMPLYYELAIEDVVRISEIVNKSL